MSFEIIFENAHCVAIDKPASWLSVPGRTSNDSRKILGLELELKLQLPIFPIHRLDAEVTGVIIYAKSKEFHRQANIAFENHEVNKTYQALTQIGPFKKGETFEWHSQIVRGKKRSFEATHGKPAITIATLIDRTENFLNWRLYPKTGRSHQLRFELAKHQVPILGDSLYGATLAWSQGGIALRSLEIHFPQPIANEFAIPEIISVKPFTIP